MSGNFVVPVNNLFIGQYYKSVNQNLTSGATDITFDLTQTWNNTGGYVTHTNGSTDFTVNQTGLYQLEFNTTITAATFANKLHVFFGKRGSIELVVQDTVEAEVVKNTYRFGDIVRSRTVYGVKTFIDGAQQMVDVQLSF